MQSIRMGSAEVRLGDVPIGIATDIELTFEAPVFPRKYEAEFVMHPMCRSVIEYPECDIVDEPKYWDVKSMPVYPDEPAERYQMRRLLESIPLGGVVDGKAYLIVYNRRMPEKSYVICEGF